MTECRCEKCDPLDFLPQHSQSFRLETEARHLLRLPLQARTDYLAHKGVEPRLPELMAEIARQFEAKP